MGRQCRLPRVFRHTWGSRGWDRSAESRKGTTVTTPEENRPKTRGTEQTLPEPDVQAPKLPQPRPTLGAELEDAMRRSGLSREDFGKE
ncbi:hypothetical protein Tfu_0103 [Thermobifida fusca YX]|uniref:Uncharacterized protein n=1 Tax=Thermobifida fusca (strain YX) TaxID=269800 RepID=Q47TS3_THEFY|nr:hypothetical protein Tfu_0103 [Thermobifida fusca YX]